jgi:23S rRNA (pseudouridine1915-N3)-methyltransferase
VTEDYRNKLSFWLPTEFHLLGSAAHGRDAREKKIKAEGEALADFFKTDDFVVLCDEGGRSFSSEKFARWWESSLNSGKKRIVIVIGGAYGVSESVKTRADALWSLSPLTFNHHLALAVAGEQVYRAMTILKGVSYHNA